MGLLESQQLISDLLTGELYRHVMDAAVSEESLKLVEDSDYLRNVILNDPIFLKYLHEVFKEIGIETAKHRLPEYFKRWASLLSEVGIDYILITNAINLSLRRVNNKAKNEEPLRLDDFRELLFLIVIAHSSHNKT